MAEIRQSQDPRRPDDDSLADASGAARLRCTIDKGNSASKVDYPDPAAAPLGTDAEAAGTPPTAKPVRLAEREERDRAPSAPEPGGLPRHRVMPPIVWLVLAFGLLLAVGAWLL